MSKKPSKIVLTSTKRESDLMSDRPAIKLSEKSSFDSQHIVGRVDSAEPIDIARSLIRIFKAREKYLPKELDGLGEKGWNILLELFVYSKPNHKITVADIVLATGYTGTSSLRYIDVLELKGLVLRSSYHSDKQIDFFELSERGRMIMLETLPKIANEAG